MTDITLEVYSVKWKWILSNDHDGQECLKTFFWCIICLAYLILKIKGTIGNNLVKK